MFMLGPSSSLRGKQVTSHDRIADCNITFYVIVTTFVIMSRNVSELDRDVTPTYKFFEFIDEVAIKFGIR